MPYECVHDKGNEGERIMEQKSSSICEVVHSTDNHLGLKVSSLLLVSLTSTSTTTNLFEIDGLSQDLIYFSKQFVVSF